VLLLERSRPHESELNLVRRAQAGDRVAFEDLVRRCYRQIHRWALGVTGDADDADDVVQEVLVRLHKRLESYAGRSRFSTWLFQVTRNTALEQQRKRARRQRLLLGFKRAEVSEDSVKEYSVHEMQTSHVVDQVRSVFERLPARQREVFDLADLQGHSPGEIGDMLGMNPVTVRANLCKARRAIRAKILERFPDLVEDLQT
jgi:RNA polymerase sigma-70 factor (ECF subfamily)